MRRLLAPLALPCLLAGLLAASRPARAENPNWPPSPLLDRQALADPSTWPDDGDYGGDWNYWGFTPQAVLDNPLVPAYEKAVGIGMSVDRAWQRSRGDPRVAIAVIDSGFKWDNRDLANKWLLNQKELPRPNRDDCVKPGEYDCNGDGLFNIQDYTTATGHQSPNNNTIADKTLLARADHGDVNGNGFLDPQDLIAIFSDGKDGYGDQVEGNGFVDDICGWDFLWNDNDAFDDIGNGGQGYSHGAAEANDSTAEGNNGMGDIGVCPLCMVLPLRGGDSFVAEGTNQALAMLYGSSRGVKVMQAAQITITNPPFLQYAIDTAWERGAILVASSADETSMHQMAPGNLEHTLLVDGMYYDGSNWNSANTTTFTNFSNGTNWGGHLHLTSSASSSSESTGKVGGEMGLIFSYALQLGIADFTPAEAFQVAIHGVYDVSVPNSALDPTKFPSGPGWDSHFSYGRPDMRAALEQLHDGRIPPEVYIDPSPGPTGSPQWFQVYDPKRTPIIDINGTIDTHARGARSFDYIIEAAKGLEPRDSEFAMLTSGTGSGQVKGKLATLNLPVLMGDTTPAPTDPHQYALTVRIRATAHYGDARGDVQGEYRKTIFAHQDDDVFTAFPINIGGGGESSPKLFDLDGDGKDEIILATADGLVHVYKFDGTELAGFPAQVSPYARTQGRGAVVGSDDVAAKVRQSIFATPAIGDIDGDGKPEIIVSTMGGEVHAFDTQGHEKAGFPAKLDGSTYPKEVPGPTGMHETGDFTLQSAMNLEDGGHQDAINQENELELGFFASPVLADLDGDGKLDIIQPGMDGYLHAYGADGHEKAGFPVQLRDRNGSQIDGVRTTLRSRVLDTPAVGDIDGDGKPEILVTTSENHENNGAGRGYLVKPSGAPSVDRSPEAFMPGWPVRLPGALVFVLPYVGKGAPNNPVMADLDGDGVPELFVHAVGTAPEVYGVDGLKKLSSSTNTGYTPYPDAGDIPNVSLSIVNSGTVADLDGDGNLDYIDGTVSTLDLALGASGAIRHKYDHQVSVWSVGKTYKANAGRGPSNRADAKMLPAWPKVVPDYQFLTNYAVADVSGDSKPEVISGSGGFLVTAFDADGNVPAGWPKFHGGWTIGTPAVGDLDGDGKLDVVVVNRAGWLWAWHTKASAIGNVQWEGFHHDVRNTGNVATALQPHQGPSATTGSTGTNNNNTGCGCTETPAGLWTLLGLPLLFRRRRS